LALAAFIYRFSSFSAFGCLAGPGVGDLPGPGLGDLSGRGVGASQGAGEVLFGAGLVGTLVGASVGDSLYTRRYLLINLLNIYIYLYIIV